MSGVPVEDEHVHKVYESIACHFSKTRYKPWPRVDRFIREQKLGSVGVDLGAGNGKYLGYEHVYMIASDRSEELTRIAAAKAARSADSAMRGDALAVSSRPVDFALSIAVVHHFSTRERRVAAIRAVLSAIRPGDGRALIYVWALEQAKSRRGWDVGMDQDVMVPWVDNTDPTRKYERYYHLYRSGEVEEDVLSADGVVIESGYEKDNWWVVAAAKSP